tara:strand:+ start:9263 stop:10108 length:846 start_codon:yes stop_codon:yes gene_type:complete
MSEEQNRHPSNHIIPHRPETPGYLFPRINSYNSQELQPSLSRTGRNRRQSIVARDVIIPPPLPPRPSMVSKEHDDKLIYDAAMMLMKQTKKPQVVLNFNNKPKRRCWKRLCGLSLIIMLLCLVILYLNKRKFIQSTSPRPRPQPTQQPIIEEKVITPLLRTSQDTSYEPTEIPSYFPTNIPTKKPSHIPSRSPSSFPTINPSSLPTNIPSLKPSIPLFPTQNPTTKFRKVNNFNEFLDALQINDVIIDIRENIYVNNSGLYITPGNIIKLMSSEGSTILCK